MQAGIDHDPGGLAQNETRAVEVLRLQKFKEHSNHRLVSNFVRDARAGKVKRMHNEHSHDPAHGPCQTVCRDVACLECWQHNPEQCSVCRPWLERVLRSSVHHLSLFMANEPGRLQKGNHPANFVLLPQFLQVRCRSERRRPTGYALLAIDGDIRRPS